MDWDPLTLQRGSRDQADGLMQGQMTFLYQSSSLVPLYFQRQELLSQSALPTEDA